MAAVARELGLGERQLERRFLARVGVTPKAFAQLRRFERVLARAATAMSLGALAQDAGYYDQSHFIREFRRFAGAAPSAVTIDEQLAFGRRSVERTAPADQRMMLGWMLPAMTRIDANAFLANLPPALAAELRPLAG